MSVSPDKPASWFARFSLFGWLTALVGFAVVAAVIAPMLRGSACSTPSLVIAGLGLVLVLLGGVCIDRTPVASFIALGTGAIAAWRGKPQ